jgi:Cys-tRNA(Pro)/Cys-tRNA(Cys) deacylase
MTLAAIAKHVILVAMTPAVRALEAAGIEFSIHEYDRGDDLKDFGREAADALDLPYDQVFKTLVVDGDNGLAVAVLPVSCLLSMKLVATALGIKRVAMADPRAAERSSGYVVGGISPLGQRKALPTVIDETAELFDLVYVSGGKRGMDVAIAPDDLVRVLGAVVAPITA